MKVGYHNRLHHRVHALAADLPVKAPRYAPPPPAPVFSWTGFYIGGNVGYSWGDPNTDFNADPVTVIIAAPATIPGFVGSESVKPKGIIGGGQSATTGSSRPIGSGALRPTFKLPVKKPAIVLAIPSPSLFPAAPFQ